MCSFVFDQILRAINGFMTKIFMHVYVGNIVTVYMWRPKVDKGNHPLPLPTLVFETRSLMEAH